MCHLEQRENIWRHNVIIVEELYYNSLNKFKDVVWSQTTCMCCSCYDYVITGTENNFNNE